LPTRSGFQTLVVRRLLSGNALPSCELVLRGIAQLVANGFPAGTDLLRDASVALRDAPDLTESDLPMFESAYSTLIALWDVDSGTLMARREVDLARQVGALPILVTMLSASADWSDVRGGLRRC
jgi:hypothetical protein